MLRRPETLTIVYINQEGGKMGISGFDVEIRTL
jgi:hypothetical protein